ncbi:MAG TPA: endonuclease III [Ktedonobacterales bacterium]
MALVDAFSGALSDRVDWLYDRLVESYGEPEWRPNGDPVGELVQTILSQHTSDVNSERAYERLKQTFADWPTVRDANVSDVEEAIRVGGLAKVKAERIQKVLHEIGDRSGGAITLDQLRELSLDDARDVLVSFSGVGPKTASCVLLFALGAPAFPVDTHVLRVTRRLGLISPKVSAESAHGILEAAIPPDRRYAMHINLIRHGRRVCHAQRPACERCMLRQGCHFFWAKTHVESVTTG